MPSCYLFRPGRISKVETATGNPKIFSIAFHKLNNGPWYQREDFTSPFFLP
jgi:hypothetical protein